MVNLSPHNQALFLAGQPLSAWHSPHHSCAQDKELVHSELIKQFTNILYHFTEDGWCLNRLDFPLPHPSMYKKNTLEGISRHKLPLPKPADGKHTAIIILQLPSVKCDNCLPD